MTAVKPFGFECAMAPPPANQNIELSEKQQEALDAFQAGKNVFLTGPGGSGKSELIRHMVLAAAESGKTVQVCALTGCAAVLLNCPGAKTLHSWSGIGLANDTNYRVVDRVVKNKFKRKTWNSVDVLIIDEVSMMSKKLFDILDEIGRRSRKALNRPFGGLQVVFSGDFYQLPPVGNSEDPDSSTFCFESDTWVETFDNIIVLSRIFRQHDDAYAKVLNQIRVGKLSKSGFRLLSSRVGLECDDRLLRPTILMPRRRHVDMHNALELDKLEGEEHSFAVSIVRDAATSANAKSSTQFTDKQVEQEYTFLKSSMMADQRLVLKVGTQVMCIANLSMENGIVNGSQGVVTHFDCGLPVVEFRNGHTQRVGHHTWASDVVEGLGAKQIPLIHAWAITIHKAQGVTLELACIDVGSRIFEPGQTYVALSRVKSIEGLYLTAFDPQKIQIKTKVKKFYQEHMV
jgi:ATP-dependent DNA helicase PIF1